MKLEHRLIIFILMIVGWSMPMNAISLDDSKVFSGKVPSDIFTSSYRIGMWQPHYEVRKYRSEDGKDIFLIGLSYDDLENKEFLIISKENLTSYLIFLNQLGNESSKFADNPENEGKYADFSPRLREMKSNNEELLIINKDLKPQLLRSIIWRKPFMSYSINPSPSLFYLLEESFEVPGLYLTSDGEVIQNFENKESIKNLVDILRTSMLSNDKTLNPDMYKRLGTYLETPIIGSATTGDIRAILGFGSGNNARYYIEGAKRYIEGDKYSSFIWLRKSESESFLKWLKYLHKQYSKVYKKGPRKNGNNESVEYKDPENLKLGGWLIGNFDVDMTIADGQSFSPTSRYFALSQFDKETGIPGLFISFGECYFNFGSPSELEKIIKALETE